MSRQLTEAQAWREVARQTIDGETDTFAIDVPFRIAVAMGRRWNFWTGGKDTEATALAALWLAEEAEAESNG